GCSQNQIRCCASFHNVLGLISTYGSGFTPTRPDSIPGTAQPIEAAAFESSAPDFTSLSDQPPPERFNSLDELTHDLGSLHELSTRGSWEAILDKISQTRALFLLTKPHEHLTYLTYQVMALTKLRRSDEASRELDSLHDFDDGAHYRGRIREKVDDCSVELWRKRERFVMSCLLGFHLGHKEFGVSLDVIKELIKRDPLDPVLVSKLGNLVGRNKALVHVVAKDYAAAVREYEECIERDSSDVVAVNNKALCLMYLRDLSDAIKVMESALERVPTAALNESLVVNLCSMYELAYVNHTDAKRTLNTWITRVAPDDFDSSCTRM
ncbi:unnamed protein product, partial [Brassica napus]